MIYDEFNFITGRSKYGYLNGSNRIATQDKDDNDIILHLVCMQFGNAKGNSFTFRFRDIDGDKFNTAFYLNDAIVSVHNPAWEVTEYVHIKEFISTYSIDMIRVYSISDDEYRVFFYANINNTWHCNYDMVLTFEHTSHEKSYDRHKYYMSKLYYKLNTSYKITPKDVTLDLDAKAISGPVCAVTPISHNELVDMQMYAILKKEGYTEIEYDTVKALQHCIVKEYKAKTHLLQIYNINNKTHCIKIRYANNGIDRYNNIDKYIYGMVIDGVPLFDSFHWANMTQYVAYKNNTDKGDTVLFIDLDDHKYELAFWAVYITKDGNIKMYAYDFTKSAPFTCTSYSEIKKCVTDSVLREQKLRIMRENIK